MNDSIFEKNLEKLEKYRPDLSWPLKNIDCNHLEFCYSQKGELNLKRTVDGKTDTYHSSENIQDETLQWWQELVPNKQNVVFVFGIGLGYIYDVAKDWLHQNPSNRLILLEDDLAVLHRFLETEKAGPILDDPQVLVHHFEDLRKHHYLLEELLKCTIQLPFRVLTYSITALPYYFQEKNPFFYALAQTLIFLDESLSYFFKPLQILYQTPENGFLLHYYTNLFTLEGAYLGNDLKDRFKNIPAIICGAGPSLEKHLNMLKDLTDNALIFAGGTAINILNHHHITPHFCAGTDPNDTHYARVLTQTSYEAPYFYTYRMFHQAVDLLHGPRLLVAKENAKWENWFNKEFHFEDRHPIDPGHSISTICLSMAHLLGCNPIILVGMDLAITDKKAYARGNLEHPLIINKKSYKTKKSVTFADVSVNQQAVQSTYQFIGEAKWISEFSQDHPEIRLLNATEGGRAIPKVPNHSLIEVIQTELTHPTDLLNKVHQEIQLLEKLPLTKEDILKVMHKWQQSWERCKSILQQLLKLLSSGPPFPPGTVGQLALLESDLSEEATYKHDAGFLDYELTIVLKARERWNCKDNASEHYLETQFLSTSRLIQKFQILLDYSQLNLDDLATVLNEIKPQEAQKKSEGHPPAPISGTYKFEKETLTLIDPDIPLFFNGPFRPPLVLDLLSAEQKEQSKGSAAYQMFQGKYEGQFLLFYPDGTIQAEMFYMSDLLHGPSSFYSPQGMLLARSWFLYGKRMGKTEQYYPSGKLYSLQQFQEGLLNGPQTYYYENGVLKTFMHYQKNMLQGDVKLYGPNGQLLRENHFFMGRRVGPERLWYPNGQLMFDLVFEHDKPVGIANSWKPDGQPDLHLVFNHKHEIIDAKEF